MLGYGMGFGGIGFIFMALFWIAVIGGCIWLLGNLFPRNNTQNNMQNAQTALDILQKRYARGELTKEEFTTMRSELER